MNYKFVCHFCKKSGGDYFKSPKGLLASNFTRIEKFIEKHTRCIHEHGEFSICIVPETNYYYHEFAEEDDCDS